MGMSPTTTTTTGRKSQELLDSYTQFALNFERPSLNPSHQLCEIENRLKNKVYSCYNCKNETYNCYKENYLTI